VEPRGLIAPLAAVLALAGCETAPPRAIPDPFCRERPRIPFCEDFDEAPLPGVFDSVLGEGASLVIDDRDSASGPSSLLASASSTGRAAIVRRFEAGYKFRVFLQARIDALPTGDTAAELVVLDLDADGAPSYRVALGYRGGDGTWFVSELRDEVRTELPASGPLPLGHWVSVRFDYEVLATGEARMHVRFGNDSVVDALLTPPAPEAIPTLAIGLDATGSGPWQARFDNVTFDLN
jgi:hypothetical protein